MTTKQENNISVQIPQISLAKKVKNFAVGGIAGCVATTFVQPIDMVKTRIQVLSGENVGQKFGPVGVTAEIWRNEGGVRAFYKGLDSAWMRQLVYSSAKFGFFLSLSDHLKSKHNVQQISFLQKMQCSLTAGALAALLATPTDLILVRMQSDSTLPPEQRRNYKSVFEAARRIPAEEGITKLWNGVGPTIAKSMAINLVTFTTYEETKERLARIMPNNQSLSWFIASMLAGSLAATVSLPFDNAKTKMQKMTKGPDGKYPYRNIFDAMLKTARASGAGGLWVGLPMYCIRIAPHVMISFQVAERIKKALAM